MTSRFVSIGRDYDGFRLIPKFNWQYGWRDRYPSGGGTLKRNGFAIGWLGGRVRISGG